MGREMSSLATVIPTTQLSGYLPPAATLTPLREVTTPLLAPTIAASTAAFLAATAGPQPVRYSTILMLSPPTRPAMCSLPTSITTTFARWCALTAQQLVLLHPEKQRVTFTR